MDVWDPATGPDDWKGVELGGAEKGVEACLNGKSGRLGFSVPID